MGLDHSEAFVRLKFDGLIAFCFRRREDGRCDMGMVNADDHEPLLNITCINRNGTRTAHTVNRRLRPEDNIQIKALNPVDLEASTFPARLNPGEFDRLSNLPDPEDFRWIVNLQGEDFHGPELRPLQQGVRSGALLPRITIPHGIFYTLEKTEDQFERITGQDDARSVPIGKIADAVGVDIRCHADAGGQKTVELTIGDDKISLLRDDGRNTGLRYFVEITNLCRPPGSGGKSCPNESDFRKYYDVFVDTDGIQFDLRSIYSPDDPRGRTPIPALIEGKTRFPQFAGFRANGPPQVCSCVFLGVSNSLP